MLNSPPPLTCLKATGKYKHEEGQPKTAFTMPYGLLKSKVLLFGLQGATTTFQPMMNILNRLSEFAAAYSNDIVIHNTTWEDHIKHVSCFLECLAAARQMVKLKKYQFAMSTCVYLGGIVGNGEVLHNTGKKRKAGGKTGILPKLMLCGDAEFIHVQYCHNHS